MTRSEFGFSSGVSDTAPAPVSAALMGYSDLGQHAVGPTAGLVAKPRPVWLWCEELRLANNVASWPNATSWSVNHDTTRSVPPYNFGGTLSDEDAICAMRILFSFGAVGGTSPFISRGYNS